MSAISIEHKHTQTQISSHKKLIVKNEQQKNCMQKTFFCSYAPSQSFTRHKTNNQTHVTYKKSQKPNTNNKKKPKSNLLKWTQDVKQTTEALTFKEVREQKKYNEKKTNKKRMKKIKTSHKKFNTQKNQKKKNEQEAIKIIKKISYKKWK